ncbi:MAG: hypothetical protein ND895_21730 [Pyrinomonadaceae bacterium]|nr:hypothetical protein [Pyrinomonadaceae bacterium]
MTIVSKPQYHLACSQQGGTRIPGSPRNNTTLPIIITILLSLVAALAGCQAITDRQDVRPLVLRDVPAQRLAYRFETDVGIPAELQAPEPNEKLASVQADFTARRANDALLRTVASPDGQRTLALYGTEDEPGPAFRIDLYASDGRFLKNLIPPTLSCVFPETVAWTSDGNFITFIAHKRVMPAPTPTPPIDLSPEPESSPLPAPSVAPAFPAVATFNTEQIYICNRDGYDLRPLTAREGLIYFYYSWAPDNHALVALACKESEWDAREKSSRLPAGRPRLIAIEGNERLLDDQLTETLPVWSPDSAKVVTAFETETSPMRPPDSSKVATEFETDVAIYDTATNKPTQARIRLTNALVASSITFEEKNTSGRKKSDDNRDKGEPAKTSQGPPSSFNPIVRVEWPSPEALYLQTAYVRVFRTETINTFQRWHRLLLSPQAAVLK